MDSISIIKSGPSIKRIKYSDFLSPYLSSVADVIDQVIPILKLNLVFDKLAHRLT
jgi:hypothetical protein